MKSIFQKVMKRAWEIKKEDSRNIFGVCLKIAWKEIKEELKDTVYTIADWFMNKNLDKVTTNHLRCFQSFERRNILKETKKAVYVELEMQTNSGYESRYTRKIWVPKSVITEHAERHY